MKNIKMIHQCSGDTTGQRLLQFDCLREFWDIQFDEIRFNFINFISFFRDFPIMFNNSVLMFRKWVPEECHVGFATNTLVKRDLFEKSVTIRQLANN